MARPALLRLPAVLHATRRSATVGLWREAIFHNHASAAPGAYVLTSRRYGREWNEGAATPARILDRL